jgi:hypothetical protein
MKLELKMNGTYIPAWNGNRELEEKEQISVEFRYLTLVDREDLIDKSATIMSLSKKLWDKNVVSVKGIDLEVDGNVKQFTPDMIYELPELNELFQETANFVMTSSCLKHTEKKN